MATIKLHPQRIKADSLVKSAKAHADASQTEEQAAERWTAFEVAVRYAVKMEALYPTKEEERRRANNAYLNSVGLYR
jgi:hypothetical protein